MISQNVTQINEVPLRSQTTNEAEYRIKVEAFLVAAAALSRELSFVVPQINATELGINSAVNNASNVANQIILLKNEVVAKAAEIKSYVIPTTAINLRRIKAMQILN